MRVKITFAISLYYIKRTWSWKSFKGKKYDISFKILKTDYLQAAKRRSISKNREGDLYSEISLGDYAGLEDLVEQYKKIIIDAIREMYPGSEITEQWVNNNNDKPLKELLSEIDKSFITYLSNISGFNELIAKNVANENNPFEDWWVDPNVVDVPKEYHYTPSEMSKFYQIINWGLPPDVDNIKIV